MRRVVASGLVAGVAALDRLAPAASRSTLAVLTLHDVPDRAILATELDDLRRVRTPIDLDTVLAAHRGDAPLPPRAVLVTLDDAHPSVPAHAEVFADKAVPAVCFAVSGLVGTDRPYWWDEVRLLTRWGARHSGPGPAVGDELVLHLKGRPDAERRAVLDELRAQVPEAPSAHQVTAEDLRALEAAGIEVGGHSVTHPILAACDDEALEREVTVCRDQLASILGHVPRAFAYPSGRVDDRVVEAVRSAGWEIAFAWDHALAEVPFADPLRVSRLRYSLGSSRVRLVRLLTARHPSLR